MLFSDTSKGALPYQYIKSLISSRAIKFNTPVDDAKLEDQLQSATLDSRIGDTIYRVDGFHPPSSNETVEQVLRNSTLYSWDISSSNPNPVERTSVKYVVKLNEHPDLPSVIYGGADTKSTGGRNFFRCKLVVDNHDRYNEIPAGYSGPLFMEFSSMAFLEVLRSGDPLLQIRFYNGDARVPDKELRELQTLKPLVFDKSDNPMPANRRLINNGLVLTLDVESDVVGYNARPNHKPILYGVKGNAKKWDYWSELRSTSDGLLYTQLSDKLILATKESVSIPDHLAARMRQYDQSITGDDKTNEAGYFDSNFSGYGVLEYVPSFDGRVLRDGMPIAVLEVERLIEPTKKPYNGNYQKQKGPKLAKQFY